MRENKNYLIYILIIVSIIIYFSLIILEGRFTGLVTKVKHLFPQSNSIGNDIVKRLVDEVKRFENTPSVNEIRNSMGFKDYEHSIEKSNNTFRIIALGDSMTDGVNVATEFTWPKQLEKKLNSLNLSMRFEVFNMGKAGACTLEELEIFKEIGLKYNPDMVILQYYGNDWEDPEVRIRALKLWKEYQKGTYRLPHEVEEAIKEVNASERTISRIIYHYLLSEYYSTVDIEKEWDRWVKPYLIELIEITKKKNISLIVITWDMGDPIQKKKLTTLLQEYQIPFLDFSADLLSYPIPSRIRLPDYHLTPLGYEIVANKTLEILLNEASFKIY